MKLFDDIGKLWSDITSGNLSGLRADALAGLRDLKDALAFLADLLPTTGATADAMTDDNHGERHGRHLLARIVRHHALKEALAAGKSEAQFNTAWDAANSAGMLSDVAISTAAIQMGAIGDGKILGLFQKLIDWLSDPANQAKIMALVKWAMSILALFGL